MHKSKLKTPTKIHAEENIYRVVNFHNGVKYINIISKKNTLVFALKIVLVASLKQQQRRETVTTEIS